MELQVKKLRPHLKFISGDYLTYQTQFQRTHKGTPWCKICELENGTISHILAIILAHIYQQSALIMKQQQEEL